MDESQPDWRRGGNQDLAAGIARIDERTKNTDIRITEIARSMDNLRTELTSDVSAMNAQTRAQFISRDEFKSWSDKVNLHQQILFTGIGLTCLSVLTAILALVIRNGHI